MIFNINTLNEAISDKTKDIAFKSDKDLYSWMKSNISYDWNSKKLKSHDKVIDDKSGNCHDQVMFELEELKKLGKNAKAIFLIEYNKEGKGTTAVTHSFVYYNNKNKIVWFENAWKDQAGIKEYDSLYDIKQDIIKLHNDGKWGDVNKYPEIEFASFGSHKPGESLSELVDKCLDESISYEPIFVSTLRSLSEVNNMINANIAYNESFLDNKVEKVEVTIIKDIFCKYKDIFYKIYEDFCKNGEYNGLYYFINSIRNNVVYIPDKTIKYDGAICKYKNIQYMRTNTTLRIELNNLLSMIDTTSEKSYGGDDNTTDYMSNDEFLYNLRHNILGVDDYKNYKDLNISSDDYRNYYIKNLLFNFFRDNMEEEYSCTFNPDQLRDMVDKLKSFDNKIYYREIGCIINDLDNFIVYINKISECSNFDADPQLIYCVTKRIALVLQTYAELYAARFDAILEYYTLIMHIVSLYCKIESKKAGGNK